MKNLLRTLFFASCLSFSFPAYAEETTAEKVEAGTNKAVDKTKSTYRNAENEVCEMVNGTLKCLPNTVENKAKSGADTVKTKSKELKNKVD
jgi:hypothetical protein